MQRKEIDMIELRDDQLKALDAARHPVSAIDPRTGKSTCSTSERSTS
jgi:hypothetical protein